LVRAQDVSDAVALGVDAIGLVFYPNSPRYLSMEEALVLRRLLPSYVACVGLFVNAQPMQVRDYREKLGLDVIQFHGDESMPEIAAIFKDGASTESASPRSNAPFWRALRVKPDSNLLELASEFPLAEAVLLDAYSDAFGGTGQRFDWSLAKALPKERMILSGGLDAESVGEAIAGLAPFAVDVSSGIQAEHARAKSLARMEQFVAAVQKADFLKVKQ
jgi:phosphoribosylanthranilate isomerase